MTPPIKLVIKKVKPIIAYFYDLPAFFDNKFRVYFAMKSTINLIVGIVSKMNIRFTINSKFQTKSLLRMLVSSKFIVMCKADFRNLTQLYSDSKFICSSKILAKLKLRSEIDFKTGFLSNFKALVVMFTRHIQINDKKISEVNFQKMQDFLSTKIT